MTRDEAMALLQEYTKSESLIRHALAVEACMGFYAQKFGEDEELWRAVGLLHDFDYEQNPEAPAHTQAGARILRERGVDEAIVGAMLSHADWNVAEYPRDTLLRKTLYAVDELAGFILAVAYVRPDGLNGMMPKSVKKKLKDKSFAAAVNRADVTGGAELLGIDLDEHINNCITALNQANVV